MLEQPDVPVEQIAERVSEAYALPVRRVTFLPIGVDINTAAYRVDTTDGRVFFLKLRKHFQPVTALIPRYLFDRGVRQVLAPLKTCGGALWAAGPEEFTCLLYPWCEGRNGFEQELTARQWAAFGAALKQIHTTPLPDDLRRLLPAEDFSPHYRRAVVEFLSRVERQTCSDPLAAEMAAFLRSKREIILRLVTRAEQLADALRHQPLDWALCHADIHAGNLLVNGDEGFSIVDWDDCVLAPKERDLMFIGGGIGGVWDRPEEEMLFYQGYGESNVNRMALAYYRFERIVEDIAAFCKEILLTSGDSIDRRQWYGYFTGQFEPGAVIDIACRTDQALGAK